MFSQASEVLPEGFRPVSPGHHADVCEIGVSDYLALHHDLPVLVGVSTAPEHLLPPFLPGPILCCRIDPATATVLALTPSIDVSQSDKDLS